MVGNLFTRIADEKFAKEAAAGLPHLFREHAATVIANAPEDYAEPRAFDHSIARLQAASVALRLHRRQLELTVEAAAGTQWTAVAAARSWDALDADLASPPIGRGFLILPRVSSYMSAPATDSLPCKPTFPPPRTARTVFPTPLTKSRLFQVR